MSTKLRYNNHSVVVARRVRALFNKINRDVSTRDKTDVRDRTARILESFRTLYSNLGKPTVELRPFEPKQVPRSEKLNKTMGEIEQDLTIAYEEVGGLRQGFVETFNHAQSASADLLLSSQNIASKVIDLRLLAGQQDQNILVAGDDFTTLEKVDQSIGLQNQRADVLIDQGAVTLGRTLSNNVVNNNTEIKVVALRPETVQTRPTIDNVNRFYEGNFYNYIGSSRPEGGRFHLEEVMSVNANDEGITVTTGDSYNVPVTSDPSNVVANEFARHRALINKRLGDPTQPPSAGERLRPEDVIVYDRGASDGEKQIIRRNLVDEDPSSMWECEYVKTEDSIQQRVNIANIAGLDTLSSLSQPQGVVSENLASAVTLDDLRSEASGLSRFDEDDLVVDITMTLDAPQDVNWISIIPNNFNETAWIDVLDISTSEATDSAFTQIPGFTDAVHDNVLTDEANAELTDEESGALLAPNKYAYRGVGVWNFQSVTAKVVRIRLRQRTAVPAPYQRLAIRLHRVFTAQTVGTSAPSGM